MTDPSSPPSYRRRRDGVRRGHAAWVPGLATGQPVDAPSGRLVAARLGHATTHLGSDLSAGCTPPESWSYRCPPPEVVKGHTSPSILCTCGIYAWYAPDDAGMLSARVFGVVEASGLVLMGDSGFRAQQVRIVAVVTRTVASRRRAPQPASRSTGAAASCSRTTPAMI